MVKGRRQVVIRNTESAKSFRRAMSTKNNLFGKYVLFSLLINHNLFCLMHNTGNAVFDPTDYETNILSNTFENENNYVL